MKNHKYFLYLMAIVAVFLSACGGGSNDDEPPGGNIVDLSAVQPLYPANGANWNDYIKNDGPDFLSASDTACDGTESGGIDACFHGGERLVLEATGKSACSGLTAADSLAVLEWVCDASTNPVRFVSTGLADGKHLSDLIDFSGAVWRSNGVRVYQDGKLYGITPSTVWWTNSVVVDNDGSDGSDMSSGDIRLVTANPVTPASYTIGSDKVAFLIANGIALQGTGISSSKVIDAYNKNYLWIEGEIDAAGTGHGILLSPVRHAVIRNARINGALYDNVLIDNSIRNRLVDLTVSSGQSGGLALVNSSNNDLRRITADTNTWIGVYLGGINSKENALIDVIATGNSTGITLADSSNNNRLQAITASDNGWAGIELFNASSNSFSDLVASNNVSDGLIISGSSNNYFSNIRANAANYSGIRIENFSHDNTFHDVRLVDNLTGLYLIDIERNRFSHFFAANNTSEDIYLLRSNNNVFSQILAANSGLGSLSCVSSISNVISVFTTALNVSSSIGLHGGCEKTSLVNVAVAGSVGQGLGLLDSNDNHIQNISVSTGPSGIGINLSNSLNNRFSGLLKIGGNYTDCEAPVAEGAGLKTSTGSGRCIIDHSISDATLVEDVDASNSVVGRVTSDDIVNTSDNNSNDASPVPGAAEYDNITDWFGFENRFRAWGMDGTLFSFSPYGACYSSQICRIWDWSLADGDTGDNGTPVMQAVLTLPTGDDANIHEWQAVDATACAAIVGAVWDGFSRCQSTMLRHAVEIQEDGVGNDNTLCESGETCLYTPNIGAYQGHGNLVSAGSFSDGVISGVTLLRYETNGR